MPARADLAATAIALAVHAGLGYALLRAGPPRPRVSHIVEVEFRTPPPPPAPVPLPTDRGAKAPRLGPARPPARVATAAPRPTERPPPAPTPARPPVFGFTMDSAVDESSTSVPVGESTAVDPRQAAPRGTAAGATGAGGGGPAGGGAGTLAIRRMPEVDTEACGRTASYPAEALALGLEGSVKLRVSIDERGRVVDVKVLSGLGHGLDREAVEALLHRCRFTPAIANDGRPVAFVIDPYVFHFEIPR